MKHIHILGICGTFMGSLALLAKEKGYQVSGSDLHVYPPMSDLLREHGIRILPGYEEEHLQPAPDCVVIGNALSRGNKAVETVLAEDLPYTSGPQWLAEHILADRWVLAVAGTHGKTTTASMLAWILDYAGHDPGFLIGGVPNNFNRSARLGSSRFFVIEADEYDTAFFDKRSKCILYHPRTAILNNLEYDHADIFPDLAAIKQQFHFFVRTIPNNGLIVHNTADANLHEVLDRGCWSECESFSLDQGDWQAQDIAPDGHAFKVRYHDQLLGDVTWPLLGLHNVNNALAAIAAAQHVGVEPVLAINALNEFQGVKRRMEVRGVVNDITVYDDFAHHPTAIATTLSGLKQRVGQARIIAIMEFGSNTMKAGEHMQQLAPAMSDADQIIILRPDGWDVTPLLQQCTQPTAAYSTVDEIVEQTAQLAEAGDHILVMSNKGFGGIHEKLLHQIAAG